MHAANLTIVWQACMYVLGGWLSGSSNLTLTKLLDFSFYICMQRCQVMLSGLYYMLTESSVARKIPSTENHVGRSPLLRFQLKYWGTILFSFWSSSQTELLTLLSYHQCKYYSLLLGLRKLPFDLYIGLFFICLKGYIHCFPLKM